MFNCIYDFLSANFYEVMHGSFRANLHNFDKCYVRNKRKTVMEENREP